jgi:dimethylglycine dehydrogenase
MKSHAQVVIVGGGIMGVSLLYHLTKEGWRDIVLIEKGELTSGSTWHAAGQCPHFVGSYNAAKIHNYSNRLYKELEKETGQSTGWHGCGSLRLALKEEDVNWFHYVKGKLKMFCVHCILLKMDIQIQQALLMLWLLLLEKGELKSIDTIVF